jgi:hypothetical protein
MWKDQHFCSDGLASLQDAGLPKVKMLFIVFFLVFDHFDRNLNIPKLSFVKLLLFF